MDPLAFYGKRKKTEMLPRRSAVVIPESSEDDGSDDDDYNTKDPLYINEPYTMNPVDNNQFEVVPTKSKRKIATVCPNVYLNPALDLLANEDPMCNTAMEIVPIKKRKRTQSCDIVAFENSALDLGISKAAVNEFLVRELNNVKKNVRNNISDSSALNFRASAEVLEKDINHKPFAKPKFNTSEPNISILKPNFSEVNSQLNFSIADLSMETLNNLNNYLEPKSLDAGMEASSNLNNDMESKSLTAEPIYANLTDILTTKPPVALPQNNVFILPSICDTQTATQENLDMSIVEPESNHKNIDPSMTENCMEISKINDVTDSGISMIEPMSTANQLESTNLSVINNTNIQANITSQIFVNNKPSNLSLSFLDRLALESPDISNQSLIFDDDLNESNIMEIKTITIITKKERIVNPKKSTNPFLDPNLNNELEQTSSTTENPFLSYNETETEMEYNDEMINRPIQTTTTGPASAIMPRRLFTNDNNSTISTANETVEQHEYENVDGYRSESPIYENVGDVYDTYNKQSKILGHDVSHFSAVDIMNLNKHNHTNSSNESNDSKKHLKHQILKAGNKLSRKVLKTLRKTFKGDKHSSIIDHNNTLNPYEIPRKIPKDKIIVKEAGIENPALNLDTSDIEIEELEDEEEDEEHQYETIKTLRNTRLNMNVTPLRERNTENMDFSQNRTNNTPGKKVRFDSTLNQEKIITGNSFDYGIQSPGFDAKIDKYHDELENCINERKFLQQNM